MNRVDIGLSESEARISREKNGRNVIEEKKKGGLLKKLALNFSDPIIKILIGALLINIVFSLGSMDITESLGIVLAVITSVTVSTLSEYKSEKAFDKLKRESEGIKCRVYRDGICEEIGISDIVVGDAVLLSSGDAVPSDGFVIDGEISVDQSAINGESKEIKKHPSDKREMTLDSENALFKGSVITAGRAVMITERVGKNTCIGKMASELAIDTGESPLKERLARLARQISRIGYVMAVLVMIVYLYNGIVIESGFDTQLMLSRVCSVRYMLTLILNALSLGVTVIVVAVPEGLPMMICVVLSANMKKLLKEKILVKKLVGIETAGSMNILFCDKTGTLTSGKQSVELLIGADGKKIELSELKNHAYLRDILDDCARYNCECTFKNGIAQGSNATDRAVAQKFRGRGADRLSVIERIPFDSRYKLSAVRLSDGRVIVKGAPEVILEYADKGMTSDNRSFCIDKKGLRKLTDEMASRSVRVIAIATSEKMPRDGIPSELTLSALVGIRDSVRKSAKNAVKELFSAGIKIVMLTGDSKATATAVASECGITGSGRGDMVITSEELSRLSDDEVKAMLMSIAVIARALPSDKTRLVKIAQSMGLVSGMTGDGVNDAAALKKADVGFAMGSGTEVAKEAGDIVLLENDISSIVKSVLYGRTIFKSIRKFIVFQLTMNLCAVSVTLIGPFVGIDSPITIVQMLWVNMIMDTLGGLAFAGEEAVKSTLREAPKRREEPLLNKYMTFQIAWMGLSTVIICTAFMSLESIRNIFGYYDDPIFFYAALFCLFIFLGVINCFAARTERLNLLAGISGNKAFILIMCLVTVIQMLMVYFGGHIFRAAPLSVEELLLVSVLALSAIPIDIIRRLIVRLVKKEILYGM